MDSREPQDGIFYAVVDLEKPDAIWSVVMDPFKYNLPADRYRYIPIGASERDELCAGTFSDAFAQRILAVRPRLKLQIRLVYDD